MGSWVDARRGGGARSSSAAEDGYKTAAVCVRGHAATSDLESSPDLAGTFCKDCGGKIISTCPTCNSPIRGYYQVSGVLTLRKYEPPSFCVDCGNAFPWTAEKIQAASALADELENVSETDREKIKQSLNDISKDSPATSLAVARLKKLLGKASDTIGKALWKAAVEIGTEAAKKGLLGP